MGNLDDLIDQVGTRAPGKLRLDHATFRNETDRSPAANASSFDAERLTRDDLPMLPQVYRLVRLDERIRPDRQVCYTAVVYHDRASLRVTWVARKRDTRLQENHLVRIVWTGGAPRCIRGAVVIARLTPVARHSAALDLFETVPPQWVADRDILKRMSALLGDLLLPLRELITAIFWDGDRFERFCRGPSSCIGHHKEAGGNLRHSVETPESVLALLPRFPNAHASLAVAAALLHDAGKSEDYVMDAGRPTRLSDWGRLVSHKPTVTFWIGEGNGKLRNKLSMPLPQSLLHAINATKAPRELGLRDPVTPEGILLSLADRASGNGDLVRALASSEGWGDRHRHFGDNRHWRL